MRLDNVVGQDYPALTGLRAIAATLVFWHHYNPFLINGFTPFLHHVVYEFNIGVSIFFTLSGFLIAHRYANEIKSFAWKAYLIKRFARIYPMYFIITTATLFLVPSTETNGLVYVLNITFIRGFSNFYKFTLVSQGWSLTVEECFYFLAPILFIWIRKAVWAFVGLAILISIIGFLLVDIGDILGWEKTFGRQSFMLTYTFFGRCFEFLTGAALAVWANRLPTFSRYTICAVIGMSVVVLTLSVIGRDWNNRLNFWGLILHNIVLPLSTTALLHGLITENSLIRRILASPVMQVLGKASYTFYLIHLGVISIWLNLYIKHPLWFLIALQLVAVVLWRWVEEPLRKLILRWAGIR
jgi:peptidoglycan/LPS O-acetylase OafA/YrhL